MAIRKKKADATRTLLVDGDVVEITYKNVKNVNLRVRRSDGRITISTPRRVPDAVIVSFVRAKKDWIERQRTRVQVKDERESAQGSDPLAAWHTEVKYETERLLAYWEPVIGVRVKKMAYRNMTSRWGSCNPTTGRVCINIRLARYPDECLEYVVVHELCHFHVRGHGPAFKALLDRHLPDWRQRRALLR